MSHVDKARKEVNGLVGPTWASLVVDLVLVAVVDGVHSAMTKR